MEDITNYLTSFLKIVLLSPEKDLEKKYKKRRVSFDRYGASVSPKIKGEIIYRNDLETGFQDTYFVEVRKE